MRSPPWGAETKRAQCGNVRHQVELPFGTSGIPKGRTFPAPPRFLPTARLSVLWPARFELQVREADLAGLGGCAADIVRRLMPV